MPAIQKRTILSGGILAAASLITSGVAFAAQTPIAVSGYNNDIVVENTANPFAAQITGTMDSGAGVFTGNDWYSVGANAGAPTTGLPTGTTFASASDATTTFSLAAAIGNNAILLNDSQTATFTVTTPAPYSTLSFATSTGNGNDTFDVTVHFANATTQSFTGIASPDWFGGSPIVYSTNGRVDETGVNNPAPPNPNLYQENITGVNSTSNITSLDILVHGGGHTDVMAVSGTLVPEPATFATLIGGAGMLLGLRRRRA